MSASSSSSERVEWLSVAEAARRLRLDRSRVYALIRSGDLQATTDPLAGLQIDVASVERRLKRRAGAGLAASSVTAYLSGDSRSLADTRTLVKRGFPRF